MSFLNSRKSVPCSSQSRGVAVTVPCVPALGWAWIFLWAKKG